MRGCRRGSLRRGRVGRADRDLCLQDYKGFRPLALVQHGFLAIQKKLLAEQFQGLRHIGQGDARCGLQLVRQGAERGRIVPQLPDGGAGVLRRVECLALQQQAAVGGNELEVELAVFFAVLLESGSELCLQQLEGQGYP